MKIKVLQFPVRNDGDGLTQYALNNWRNVDRERFQFGFATMDRILSFESEVLKGGGKVHYINNYAEDNVDDFSSRFSRILDEGYSAVHLHTGYWKGFLCEEISKRRNVPVVIIHAHNTYVGKTRGMSREEAIARHYEQRLLLSDDCATHFCACSNAAAKWLYGPQITQDKICILPNAIDIEKFSYNPFVRDEYRRVLGLEDNFIIGHVGRFEYQKNHAFLIDMFSSICECVPNAKLMLVGIGPLSDEIEARVNRLGLSNKVLFLGKRMDVASLYQAMDVFVLPSLFEGLPISLVEAQTSGLKCLVSDAVTSEAQLTDNLTYFPLGLAAWRDAVLDIAQNSYERRDRSAEVAAAGYSIKEQIKVLERIYAREE